MLGVHLPMVVLYYLKKSNRFSPANLTVVAPPSLESILLWDAESEEPNSLGDAETASLHSMNSHASPLNHQMATVAPPEHSMISHTVLKGISSQINSASERVRAGTPTTISSTPQNVAIGMSHGYILCFDISNENLCWCCYDSDSTDQGAISAMAFNLDGTRLLIGYERGTVLMLDATNGDVIRRLADAHAPQSAVLHLRFTYFNNVALCGDSAGCVFTLSFSRRLTVKTWRSRCLFSGARGEICTFEPLVHSRDVNFLQNYIVVAMATLSKVLVIVIRPRLKILFAQPLPPQCSNNGDSSHSATSGTTTLPLLTWNIVPVGYQYYPVLVWARGAHLNYARLIATPPYNRMCVSLLRTVQLEYQLLAVHWLSQRYLATVDTSEVLHIVEVRNQNQVEIVDIAGAELVFASAHFKALALGGGVSGAFALAAETACYNSFSRCCRSHLLVLGKRTVHSLQLRTYKQRLQYLCEQMRWTEALNLLATGVVGAADQTTTNAVSTTILRDYLKHSPVDRASLTAAIHCCFKLKKMDILCNDLLEAVWNDRYHQELYYSLITEHIINSGGGTKEGDKCLLHPTLVQNLVSFWVEQQGDYQTLETCLLHLDVHCLDLDQVLRVCRRHKMYTAWIYLTTCHIGDYTAPLVEFHDDMSEENVRLGNTLLVYICSCLTGLAYPNGTIPVERVAGVKDAILRCLETVHSSVEHGVNEPPYPYLRVLLKYNIRDTFNVIELAFSEVAEFDGGTAMGQLQRERFVRILMEIVVLPHFTPGEIVHLACFITRLLHSSKLHCAEDIITTIFTILTSTLPTQLTQRDDVERQQAWLDLIHASDNNNNNNNTNGTQRISLPVTIEAMVPLAQSSKSYRVLEYLYERLCDYRNIFDCYVDDRIHLPNIYCYIRRYVQQPERCIAEQIVRHLDVLLENDARQITDLLCQYWPHLIAQCWDALQSRAHRQNATTYNYRFLDGIYAANSDLISTWTMDYLGLLCEFSSTTMVCNYIQQQQMAIVKGSDENNANLMEMLRITDEWHMVEASATVLEYLGRWEVALDRLLATACMDAALALCVRACSKSVHGTVDIVKLWSKLLQCDFHYGTNNNNNNKNSTISARQILHTAAPHLPPVVLFQLVKNVRFGDVKTLLMDIFTDYRHDIDALTVTLRILGSDMHRGLKMALATERKRAFLISNNSTCLRCSQSLIGRQMVANQRSVLILACKHAYHSDCLKGNATLVCLQCGPMADSAIKSNKVLNRNHQQRITAQHLYQRHQNSGLRPDLEGHF